MARLSRVLFVGGLRRLGSVQIRCIQIAKALGCDYRCIGRFESVRSHLSVGRYDVVVLVKVHRPPDAFRGRCVVWDVVDRELREADVYLGSSQASLGAAGVEGTVIHHHHLNNGRPNRESLTTPAWIGCKGWYPDLTGLEHRAFFVDYARAGSVRRMYRKIGIGLNLRRESEGYERHVAINSGVKLINCLGFGIPSVSEPEPSYVELGEGCTLFTSAETWADDVERLQRDSQLRHALRERCLQRAGDFSLERIAARYRKFLEAL